MSRRGRRGGQGQSVNQHTSSLLAHPLYPFSVTPVKRRNFPEIKIANGSILSSQYTRDPFRTEKVEVVTFPYNQISWGGFQVSSPGTVDAIASNMGTYVQNFFQRLVEVISFNGRFVPNQILTSAGDFVTYLNAYTQAFGALWALLSTYAAADLNTSTRLLAKGIASNGNMDTILMMWRRLQAIPIPPGIPELLSTITGAYYADAEDALIVAYPTVNESQAATYDWSAPTGANSINSLLTDIAGNLAGLEAAGSEANILTEVFGVVYGVPAPLPKPYVHSSPVEYDLHFTRAAVFDVAANQYVQPSINGTGAGGTVPVLIRRGHENDAAVKYMFSFLRPQIYDAATNGAHATSSQVGLLLNNDNAHAGYCRYYGPGSSNNTTLTDGSFSALNFGNNSFYEVEWWAAFVASTSGTVSWTGDSRSYDRWTIYYPNVALLNSATETLINEIFYKGAKIKTL